MSSAYLSVVIPAFNEERNIIQALVRVREFCELKAWPWELIIVSDGSSDHTNAILNRFLKDNPSLPVHVYINETNSGKGFACRMGVKNAEGRYVLITDTDLSSPIKEVTRLIGALEAGADVAIGSRALKAEGCDVQQSFKRHLSGRIFNTIVQGVILPGLKDTQCGFKCFKQDVAKKLFKEQKLDGFSFDVEVLYLARKMGFKIKEVPVMWRQGADTRVSLFRDSTHMVKDLFKIKKLHGLDK